MTRLDDIDKTRTTTYTVARDDLFYGDYSTQDTISANASTANPIIDVQSNFNPTYEPWKTAIIENMIIDGGNYNATVVGIRVKDVYNCWIRNVTIKNCAIGILVESSAGYESNQNRFEHIRMSNVERGIEFSGVDNGTTHTRTHIDQVGISLKNVSSAVGIQVGRYPEKLINLQDAFIKANVWLSNASSECTGMYIHGQVKHSLINLETENFNGTGGTGIQIRTPGNYNVWKNQSFTLTALNQPTHIWVSPNQSHDIVDFQV
jgi:hypothetical protein